MKKINPVKQKAMTGILKPLVYAYIVCYVFVYYSIKVLTLKMGFGRFFRILLRLIRLVKALYPNKVMRINGKYKIQLYLPAFPSRPFWHSLEKFDPVTKEPGPITVVFSMTKACTYKCPHCYQKEDNGPDVSIELLKKTAQEMQDIGVSMFDIEGGEPLIRFERLMDLLSAYDERAELWVNTTGYTLTEEKAKRLKEAGLYGVMISVHTPDNVEYDKFTGVDGSFESAKKAAKIFQKYGIVTAINFCPTADVIRAGGVEKLMQLAQDWDCSMVQIIHAKPSGGWLYQRDEIYESKELMKKLFDFHDFYNESKDASKWPSALFQVFEESKKTFGCTAGGVDRFYINHEGEIQPCEFLNVSFGNIQKEPFKVIFKRMREHFETPGTEWLCCTEAPSIGQLIKDKQLKKTPVPVEHTIELVKKWNKGEDTKLYKDLGLYKKK